MSECRVLFCFCCDCCFVTVGGRSKSFHTVGGGGTGEENCQTVDRWSE